MNIYNIYIVTNKFNSKIYIGFTNNFEIRKKQHFLESKRKKTKFYNAINKYGFDDFKFEILYQSKDAEHCLSIMEPYFISLYDSYYNGYNSDFGGRGVPVKTQSLESNIKRSKTLKGIKHKPRTAEMNAANSARQLGMKQTKQHIENAAKQKRNKKHSYDHIFNQALSQSKKFKIVDPTGKIYEGKNISEFSKNKNLSRSSITNLMNDKIKQYKGWTKFVE